MLLSAIGIWLGTPYRKTLRWFALPVAPLLALSVLALLIPLFRVTLQGHYVCGLGVGDFAGDRVNYPALWWHRLFAPAHLAAALIFAWSAMRFFRVTVRSPNDDD